MGLHYFCYAFLFGKRDLKTGIFSIEMDIFEGDTDENMHAMTHVLCKRNNWDADKIKSLVYKKIDEDFLKGK